MKLPKNWKTTVLGIAAGLFLAVNQYQAGTLDATHLLEDMAVAGLGGVAKDSTSHSTPEEVEKAGDDAGKK